MQDLDEYYRPLGIAVTPPDSPKHLPLLERHVPKVRMKRGRKPYTSAFYDAMLTSYNAASIGTIISVRFPIGPAIWNLKTILEHRDIKRNIDFQILKRDAIDIAEGKALGYTVARVRKLSDRPGLILDPDGVRTNYRVQGVEARAQPIKIRFSVDPPDWSQPIPSEAVAKRDDAPVLSFG